MTTQQGAPIPSPLPQFPIELSDADQTLQMPASGEAGSPVDAALLAEAEKAEKADKSSGKAEAKPDSVRPPPSKRPPPPPPPRRNNTSSAIKLPASVSFVASALPPVRPPAPSIDHTSVGSIRPVALDVASKPPRADVTVLVPRVERERVMRNAAIAGSLGAAVLMTLTFGVFVAGAARTLLKPASTAAVALAAEPATRTAAPRVLRELSARVTDRLPEEAEAAAAPRIGATTMGGGRTGTLRVPPSIKGMLVDGRPRRVDDGATVLTCGRHTVKTGIAPARVVDVPCGGVAWL